MTDMPLFPAILLIKYSRSVALETSPSEVMFTPSVLTNRIASKDELSSISFSISGVTEGSCIFFSKK